MDYEETGMEPEDIIVGMQLGTEEIFAAANKPGEIYADTLEQDDLAEASQWDIPPGSHDGPFQWGEVARQYGGFNSHHLLGLHYEQQLFAAMHLHTAGRVIDLKLLASNYAATAPWRGLAIPSVFAGVRHIAWGMQVEIELQFWVSEPVDKLIPHYRAQALSARMTYLGYENNVLKFKT